MQGLPSLHPATTHALPQHICPAVHSGVRTHMSFTQVLVSHGAAVASQLDVLQFGYRHPVPAIQVPPASIVQSALLGVFTQPQLPAAGTSVVVSVVHGMLSLQSCGVPGRHAPPAQVSLPLHASVSEHEAVSSAETSHSPVLALHVCFVHGVPSVSGQILAAPGVQLPALHVSFTEQALPSLHGPGVGVLVQPDAPQASLVQTLPSSQPARTQAPLQHISPVMQLEVLRQTLPSQVPRVQVAASVAGQFVGVQVG